MTFETATGLVVYAIAAALLPAGGICIAFGLIGRKLSDHPSCRACGFDLFGTWPKLKICPECGASLVASHTVVSGMHEMRKGLIALGVGLFIVGLLLHISYFYTEAVQFDRLTGSFPGSSANTATAVMDESSNND